jgi:hypothetical protein
VRRQSGHAGILDANLLAKQGDLGVEAIPLGGEADAMDGAVDGNYTHLHTQTVPIPSGGLEISHGPANDLVLRFWLPQR